DAVCGFIIRRAGPDFHRHFDVAENRLREGLLSGVQGRIARYPVFVQRAGGKREREQRQRPEQAGAQPTKIRPEAIAHRRISSGDTRRSERRMTAPLADLEKTSWARSSRSEGWAHQVCNAKKQISGRRRRRRCPTRRSR